MIYLCTTGTSAAKLWKPASLDDKRRFNESIVNEMGGVQSAAKQLLETFVQYRIDNDEHLQSKLSAVENCTLNPTGGFKALVPYAVLLGMIRRVSCRYIFEFSSQLIELPPLPVDFARSKLQSLKEVLELIERETFYPRKNLMTA
ncbi:CRISPR-associated protein (Cas_APE2256) [Thiothrix eikelboomii]|uniref:CRISPR-associated protein (Cas_APE2256) n=1 Tax=Thiothrix eikelboomii TaxID=92487 RepID=A0A1T4XCI0_9GAMM|nr:hypothetical protein [Thiothrix eikelboomii]SKA86838.1 CRISPR-associated protein (Cas_APE2256) [Thiothrix eikelboomii]